MCSLIVLAGFDANYPVLVAANRDEELARKSTPPGLFVGERHRILSPRDVLAGGTWIGVDENGRFAALTNLFGEPTRKGAPTRGRLVHLALDADDGLDASVDAVRSAVAAGDDNGFQLLVSDGRRTHVLVHRAGAGADGLEEHGYDGPRHVVAISNEHRPGTLDLGAMLDDATRDDDRDVSARLDALEPLLLHPGGNSAVPHRLLKVGDPHYGTVSGSLVAVHAEDPRQLVWKFAAGAPGQVPWRNYGNLGRRLVE